jgi:hypothetical protein
MTSKQTKKSVKKSTSNKKAPAKKAPVKKASAPKKPVNVRPEDADRLSATANEKKQQFASADKLMKTLAQQPSIIWANDVKSLPLRKRMLAWFKISK